MLADNLSLFQSQLGDLKDMQGFDPNSELPLDQSIHVAPKDAEELLEDLAKPREDLTGNDGNIAYQKRKTVAPGKMVGFDTDLTNPTASGSLSPEADLDKADELQKDELDELENNLGGNIDD